MTRALPGATALILVIAAGLVNGHWTRRWSTSHAVESAVARLGRVPMSLGDWRGRSLAKIGREQLAMAEIDGYVARRYEDRRGEAAVTILLVCGRPGPISVHTPDVCYAGAGFEAKGPPARQSLPFGPSGRPAEFRRVVFSRPNTVVPMYLSILWSWSSAGAWEAPDYPRLAFASRQVLYKLYVIREMATAQEQLEDDPSLEFLRDMLPELERALFADPSVAERGTYVRHEPPASHPNHVGVEPRRPRRSL